MDKRFRRFLSILSFWFFSLQACPSLFIDSAISKYGLAAPRVSLGDRKEKVLSILGPTQSALLNGERKEPESLLIEKATGEKSTFEIYFFWSKRIADGRKTDDEFALYIFTDGALTGICGTLLGGPKSIGIDKSGAGGQCRGRNR